MGKEKAPKPKTVKVGVKLAKEGGAFNPAIEEATTTSSSPDPLPSEEGNQTFTKVMLFVLECCLMFHSTDGYMADSMLCFTEPKGRDFSGDLKEYLEGWENKTTVTWKFNKVLQAWALSNTFDNSKIDAELFKQLCPYLVSVQGNSRLHIYMLCKMFSSRGISIILATREYPLFHH